MSRTTLPVGATLLVGSILVASHDAAATEMTVSVEIPRLNVAEYHRPYIAVWLEDADQKMAANLSVWYQQTTGKEGAGTKWLPDLRQWWRKGGRSLKVPVDGISGPTRPAGRQSIKYSAAQLSRVAPGNYTLVIEAVREVGGRELVKVPVVIAPGKSSTATAKGKAELGAIAVAIKP
ncbi:DUF2271 domain-containing protein [Luteimonas sp. FXH3W]|uniref:DUF2271 domain-containing protein n=1 Tax=Aquilutibacter rugosus TaxID=3115820 RepID=A0ABU7UXF5_9GAMM